MSIERSKTGIDYSSTAEAYGYKPIPAGFQEIPAVDVSIDWQTGAKQRQAQQRTSMNDFDTVNLQQSAENLRRQEGLLDTGTIPTDKGNLSLTTEKWVYSERGDTSLRIYLKDEQTAAEIAQFISVKRGNVWNMHDRVTSEAYRGKGVASEMIKAMENCVQAHADNAGEDQVIELTASQLPVLSVFLKNGYEIADVDKQRFAEIMGKLEAGDPKYVLASCEADFRDNREERKTWYVFERSRYELFGEKIWTSEGSRTPVYASESVRFLLIKKVKSKTGKVDGEITNSRERLHSLVP